MYRYMLLVSCWLWYQEILSNPLGTTTQIIALDQDCQIAIGSSDILKIHVYKTNVILQVSFKHFVCLDCF